MRRYLGRGLALAVMLLAMVGVTSGPARADVDIELIAESVADAGFYRDSRAPYFKSDAALDALRDSQGRKVPVYVVVLPASENPDTVLTQLMQRLNQRGTYAVLAGNKVKVRSNVYPAANVERIFRKAMAANGNRPDRAVLSMVKLMPKAQNKPAKDPDVIKRPLTETGVVADQQVAQKEVAERADKAAASDDKGWMLPAIGGAVVLLAGAGGLLLLRRRGKGKKGEAQPVGAGAPAAPVAPVAATTPDPPAAPAADQPGAPASDNPSV